jgi:prepilin-type processing-associated H-X9-DG protein
MMRFSFRTVLAMIAILALFFIAILGILTLATGVANQARKAAMVARCAEQLAQLKLALDNFEAAYGCFPPASITDLDGTPIHSWRVAALQTWKEHPINDLYDLSVPWNHAKNASLVNYDTSGNFWWCPSGDGRTTKMTDYVAVVGNETAWPWDRGLKRSEITDDPASTVLVLEVANSRIHWMEPKDPTLDEILSSGLSSHHRGFVNALFADGSVKRIRTDISPQTLKALLTVSGGETLDPASWQWKVL